MTTGNSIGVNGLIIQDGAGSTDADNLGTTLTAISFTTGGSTAIKTAALFDGSTNVSEVAVNGLTTISFSGLTLSATDGSTKNFELRVTYQASVTDNQQITFTVSSATASATSSGFAAANAGAAASTATGDINRLEVIASALAFVAQPANTLVNSGMTNVTISANDGNGNRDLDFTSSVRITSTGTLTGAPVDVSASSGLATFTSLTHSSSGSGLTLNAERTSGLDWDIVSSTFNITVQAPGLLITEDDFNYTASSNIITVGTGWGITSGNATKVNTTATSNGLTMTNYPNTNTTGISFIAGTGEDVAKSFTAQTSGSVYASTLINLSSTGVGGYVFGLTPTNTSTTYDVRVHVRTVTGNLNFGISRGSGIVTWDATNYSFSTTYFVAVKLTMNASSNDDRIDLFVSTSISNSEPSTPNATITGTTDVTSTAAVFIRQDASAGAGTIDGIRVATNWGTLVGNPQYNSSTNIATGTYNSINVISGTVAAIGNISLTGTLTVDAGATFASGGNLTLKSNAFGTASIGNSAGSITGNITVERYIPAQRRFRFLASPVVGGTAAQWRNSGVSTAGIGTHITGASGATNNFDVSLTNAPSAFSYTEANGDASNTTIGGADNAGWTAFSSGTQALANGTGYRVLVRGDRTLSLVTTPAPAANVTTLSVTGTYPTAPVTINVTRASDVAGKGWNLVGNPFPSAISWNAITKSAQMTGTYQTFNPTTNAYVAWNGATGDATDNISSGQGFLVFVASGSSYTSGSITIEEADKVSGNGGSFFKTSLKNHLKVTMKYDSNNVNNTFIHFRDQANELFDPAFDAPKLTNPGINLASKDARGDYYSINSLPLSALNDTRVVPLSVLNSVVATYTFEFSDVNSFDGQEIYLEDKYTNKTTQLSEGQKYSFTLTSDKASSNDGRFNLIFSKKSTGLVNQTKENSFILFPNPASEQIHISLLNTNNDMYKYEIYNQLGATIKSGNLDFNNQREQSIGVNEMSTGVYFIKVYNSNSTQTIKFIK